MKITYYKIVCYKYSGIDEGLKFSSREAAIRYLQKQNFQPTLRFFYELGLHGTEYEGHTASKEEFKRIKSRYKNDKTCNGFHEITFSDKYDLSIKDGDVCFSWDVFIQFFTAEYVRTPEIKKEGQPYFPEKTEIKITKESDKYSLKAVNDRLYLNKEGVNKYKEKLNFIISESEIEIID